MPINNAIAILLALSKENMTAAQLSELYNLDIGIVKRVLGELVIAHLCVSKFIKNIPVYSLRKPINTIPMLALYKIFEPQMLILCHCKMCIVPCLMHHILMELQEKLAHDLSITMVSSILIKNVKIMPITVDRIKQSCYNVPVTDRKVTMNRVTSQGEKLNTPAQRRCLTCNTIWKPLVNGINQCLFCGSHDTLQYKICIFCGKEVWGKNARITDKKNGVTRCKACLYAHHKSWREKKKQAQQEKGENNV